MACDSREAATPCPPEDKATLFDKASSIRGSSARIASPQGDAKTGTGMVTLKMMAAVKLRYLMAVFHLLTGKNFAEA